MEAGGLRLQNVQNVRCKYWFHLIKHTFHKIYCFSLVLLFLWLALIRHTYYLV